MEDRKRKTPQTAFSDVGGSAAKSAAGLAKLLAGRGKRVLTLIDVSEPYSYQFFTPFKGGMA